MSYLGQKVVGLLFNWVAEARRIYWHLVGPIIVGVKGIIVNEDGKVLLIRHSYGNRQLWYLPGGGVKKRETAADALRREVKEELNVEIEIQRLHGVYFNFAGGKSDHIIVFVGLLKGGQMRGNPEISAFSFFDPRSLPGSASPATRSRIEEFLSQERSLVYSCWQTDNGQEE